MVVPLKNQKILQNLKLETENLLQVRKSELAKLQDDSNKVLKSLRQEKEQLEEEIANLNNTKAETDWDITSYKTDIDNLESILKNLHLSVENLTDAKLALEKDIDISKKLVITLQEESESQKKLVVSLNNDISNLETQKTILVGDVESLNHQFDAQRKQNSRKIQEMSVKLQEITQKFLDAQKMEKISREDIAKRQLALDKRENVLKNRERKVEMSEQTIQNNSNLLNL